MSLPGVRLVKVKCRNCGGAPWRYVHMDGMFRGVLVCLNCARTFDAFRVPVASVEVLLMATIDDWISACEWVDHKGP